MNDNKIMNKAADNIRILAASMVEKAKSGHPGGAMGGADFINTLYSEYLVYDPEHPEWEGRDRFFLDPGHMAPMLYSQLCLIGKYTLEDLKNLRQWGSVTPGHPEREIARGIENTSGPLGQGHTFAVGAAIAAKFLKARLGEEVMGQTIYAYISDGGVQEEISQGAGRIAGNLGLDNLIMFYDANDIQLSTKTEVVTTEDTAKKYEAWGWYVQKIDGNDVDQIRKAVENAQAEKNRPSLIIGHCVMGKGARKADNSSYESNCATHGAPLGGDAYINTMKNLGADPENPFQIFPEVKEMYAKRAEELKKICAERYAKKEAWAKANPEKAQQLKDWFSGKAPKIDWSKVEQKAGAATRGASATVLGVLAEQVPNGDFSGAFFQAGVAELTMACCCIGMALHGGVIPACGTFFVFSDYMKPAVRMAALMELPVKFIWTHDAFRVGEDGPTHEPVEQEAQIRLMEKLKNHHGKNSVLVVRPADAEETTVCWRMAMENTETPTAHLLSSEHRDAARGQRLLAGHEGCLRRCRFRCRLRCHPARQRFRGIYA